MTNKLLDVQRLNGWYDKRLVLKNISFSLSPGEFVAVVGPNTAGKTSLLRAISNAIISTEGSIYFADNDILGQDASDIVKLGIVHVPEGRHVFPRMTVLDNLRIGAFAIRGSISGKSFIERQEYVFEIFPRLKERIKQIAGTLSGGEQQMLALGRAIMARPRLILLDEPSHGLAPALVSELHLVLKRLHADGNTILLVEQNVQLALAVAERGIVLRDGEIIQTGSSSSLLNDPEFSSTYLGI